MKCLYYLTSTLESARLISDDLHAAGIDDWFIHVMSKDEAGLKKDKIHSSNYLEQLDILRFGIIGAISGCLFGIVAAFMVANAELFGPDLPNSARFAIIGFFTLFGAWEGGFIGIATENKKISLFHDDLEKGKYLILIYSKEESIALVKQIMQSKHPEAEFAAIDKNFYNPLMGLNRV